MKVNDILSLVIIVLSLGSSVFPGIFINKFMKSNPRDPKKGAAAFGAFSAFIVTLAIAIFVVKLINSGD